MTEKRTVKVALLGLGTVGSGVYKLVERQQNEMVNKVGADLRIEKILVHNIGKKRDGVDASLLTDRWEDIIDDKEIEIVIEVMGGIEPARTMILEALNSGKNVVTANKDLVAEYGKELLDAAENNGVDFLFEAAVAGGIPIIRPLKQCLASNELDEVIGIINGTTNYILTKMTEDGSDYADVLKDAQAKGFAEADPTADVEGIDAANKLSILIALLFDQYIPPQEIPTTGISKITGAEIAAAASEGCKLKLIAHASIDADGNVTASVAPEKLPVSHPLAGVSNEYNAVYVTGDMVGDVMFYGKGAGALPTGSAIVGDIISIAKSI